MLALTVLLLCAAAAAALLLAAHRASAKQQLRRELASARARWELEQAQDRAATVVECVTLGWFNRLVQALWPQVERHISALVRELLGRTFDEVLAKNASKAPWRYLQSIAVEDLTFGTLPPHLGVHGPATFKWDPATSTLSLALDVRFTSSSAQAVLLVRSKPLGSLLAPVTVRLEATHVRLKGTLRLAFVLGPEPPGIQGIFYSFVEPPQLDLTVRPLGLPLPGGGGAGLPGVDSAVRGVLSKLITRRLVEPQRRYFDFARMYRNKHVARAGGPAGLLRVVVVSATNLRPEQQQQESGAAATASPRLSSYVELRFNGAVLRTPIVHHAASAEAVWNWSCSLPVLHELTPEAAAAGGGADSSSKRSSTSSSLALAVLDAQTVGEPVLLARTKASLASLQLQPNGAARTLLLPLQGPTGPQASVQLTVQWLKSTKGVPSSNHQQSQQAAAGPSRTPSASPLKGAQQQQQQQDVPGLGPWAQATPPADGSPHKHASKSMAFEGAASSSHRRAGSSGSSSSLRQSLSLAGNLSTGQPPAAAGTPAATQLAQSSRADSPAAAAFSLCIPRAAAAAAASAAAGGPSAAPRRSWTDWLWGKGAEGTAGEAGSAGPLPAAAAPLVSRPASPWASQDAAAAAAAGGLGGSAGLQDGGSASSSGNTNSPLELLLRVVRMQVQLERQRLELQGTQQQLAHADDRYQRLKQACRQRGRSALQQGGRFLLHKADGSCTHVLLFLEQQAGSSSRSAAPQQQQQLVLAALPETRSEARKVWRRMAAAEDGQALIAAPTTGRSLPVSFRRNTASGSAVGPGAAAGDAGGAVATATSIGGRMPGLSSMGARLQRRLQRGTLLQGGYESGKLERAALQQLKVIVVPRQLAGVVRGTRHFPAESALAAAAAAAGSSAGGAQASAVAAAAGECCTLLVQEEGAAQLLGINLQLPPQGNGRSLDEWLLALRDLESAAGAPGEAAVAPTATAAGAASGPAQQPPAQPTGEPLPVQGPATPAGAYFATGSPPVVESISSEGGGTAAAAAATAGGEPAAEVGPVSISGTADGGDGSLASSSPGKVPRVRSRGWLLAAALAKPWPGPSSGASAGGAGAGGDDDGSSGSDSDDSSESSGAD